MRWPCLVVLLLACLVAGADSLSPVMSVDPFVGTAGTGHFDVSGGLAASDNGQPGTAVFVTAPAGFMLMVR